MSRNNETNTAESGLATRAERLRRGLLPVLAVLAAVNVLFFALLLRPAGERAREDRDRLGKMQEDLSERRKAVARLRDIDSRLDTARKQDQDFYHQRFLPRATGFSSLMAEIEKLANSAHVRRAGVGYSLAEVPGHPELNEVQMTTTIEGEYQNVVQFINQLERDPLFLMVDQIAAAGSGQSATGPPAARQKAPVRISLRLLTYFRT